MKIKIENIESLNFFQAKSMSQEIVDIKGHMVVLLNLGGNFGYSALVYKDCRQIYFANEYALHHPDKTEKELRSIYIGILNNKLYTDEELMGEVKTYREYVAKEYFLRNYWIMRYDYLSMFHILHGDGRDREFYEKKKQYPYINNISYCYVKDKEIISLQGRLMAHLESEYERIKENNETFREAISYELSNHEACITCSYVEALGTMGLMYSELNDIQKNIVLEELNKQVEEYL